MTKKKSEAITKGSEVIFDWEISCIRSLMIRIFMVNESINRFYISNYEPDLLNDDTDKSAATDRSPKLVHIIADASKKPYDSLAANSSKERISETPHTPCLVRSDYLGPHSSSRRPTLPT